MEYDPSSKYKPVAKMRTTTRAPDVFHSPGFRNEIEANLGYLWNTRSNTPVSVTGQIAYKYRGDLEGLLIKEGGVAPSAVWTVIRMNGYFSSSDYEGEVTMFEVPGKVFFPDSTVVSDSPQYRELIWERK